MTIMILNFIRPFIVCSLLLLSSTLSWGSSITTVDRFVHHGTDLHDKTMNQTDLMAKILPVLENRVGDQKLLEKAKDKLTLMNEAQIRLIASLCERISGERGTADADIAFLLVTALIVLS